LPIQDWVAFFPILPEVVVTAGLSTLPMIEVMLGLFSTLNMKPVWVNMAIAILMVGFLSLSIVGSLAGWEIDCGCFGKSVESTFGWGMIARNSVLTGIAVILLHNSVQMDKITKTN
jgi:hypothetical protein